MRTWITLLAVLAACACPAAGRPTAAQSTPSSDAPAHLRATPELIARFFDLSGDEQDALRERLASESDLPAKLAELLSHNDPQVRWAALCLIRDGYADWAVVAAAQDLLAAELAQPSGGDPCVMAACCEVLAEWPRWDSIPPLVEALKSRREVTDQDAPHAAPRGRPHTQSLWRQADMALRLATGEWPLPEPPPPDSPAPRPAGRRDRNEQQMLLRTWNDWWTQSNLAPERLPQLTLRLAVQPPARGSADGLDPMAGQPAACCALWVRPTATAHFLWMTGQTADRDWPHWLWTDRQRVDRELPLNAMAADAVRTIAGVLGGAKTAPPAWAVAIPPWPIPGQRHGSLELITPDGRTITVELASPGAEGAAVPPPPAAEALAELIGMVQSAIPAPRNPAQ